MGATSDPAPPATDAGYALRRLRLLEPDAAGRPENPSAGTEGGA